MLMTWNFGKQRNREEKDQEEKTIHAFRLGG